MRVLFDHGTPAPLRQHLTGHSASKARDEGWNELSNGDLLNAAETASFEVLVTTDKNIRYQQNLSRAHDCDCGIRQSAMADSAALRVADRSGCE
jgi:hypothetical protein